MDKQEFIQKITDKLGADEREEKIAFKIFIDKITNHIAENSTIRIPDIGIFHLKKYQKRDAAKTKHLDKASFQYYLLAVPFTQIDEGSEIISFNVSGSKEEKPADNSYFSFSIDKPIIPLKTINKKDLLIQSSYIQLQRKFEYEVDKLFESTVSLNDFTLDFKPSELELLEIDVDTNDEMIFEDKYQKDSLGSIPWDFGATQKEDEAESVFDEAAAQKPEQDIPDQFEGELNDKYVFDEKVNDGLPIENDEKSFEETSEDVQIESLYDKEDKPASGVIPEQTEAEDDLKVDSFSMDYFKKSAPTIPEEKEQQNFVSPKETVSMNRIEEEVHVEKSNKIFWISISFIILLTVAGLYYYFFIIKISNDSVVEEKSTPVENVHPVTTNDSLLNARDSLQTKETIVTKTEVAVKSDSLIRTDNKFKQVGEYFYTDGKTYTIQISSWKSRKVAEKEVVRLRSLNLDAYLAVKYPKSASPWYLVRIGDYPDLQDARKTLSNIK